MQELSQEKDYLRLCKSKVEEKLNRRPGHEWKQRDFLQLIELMEQKTGVLLSLSTLKRIWKPDFEGTPQPATLEAFARFLDFRDWLDFKTSVADTHPPGPVSEPAAILSRPRFSGKSATAMAVALLAGMLLTVWICSGTARFFKSPTLLTYHPEDLVFSCTNSVDTGVPNTVIFEYDVHRVRADSFFIQQSWDKRNREKISPQGRNLTSIYYYPGFHRAKLIANDSILRETDVRISTDGWLAMARNGYEDEAPVYFRKKFPSHGLLQLSPDQLRENNVSLTPQSIVSYYNIGSHTQLSSGDFTLETRLKCDSTLNIACPLISIILQGEGEMYYIPLTTKGCVGNIGVKLGDVVRQGKHHDLSALGARMYEWQNIRLHVHDHVARVYLNDRLVLEQRFKCDIGKIQGVNINFTGLGSVEYLRLFSNSDPKHH